VINAGILALPALLLIALLLHRVIKRGLRLGRAILLLATATYGFGLISITLFPIPYQRELIAFERSANYLTNNVIPFRTIGEAINNGVASAAGAQAVLNVALFVPLGYLVPLTFRRHRPFRRLLVVAVATTLLIEASQLLMSWALGYTYKVFDVDDVLLNAAGSVIGYAAYALFGQASLELLDEGPARAEPQHDPIAPDG